ncbi:MULTISPECIES: lysozyme inhibitor LprI family protein [unclassified Ensifer]|uniref:lysozyme inhibitor LprI family protein n=1 Tax=unclassified Ensifer TaxID=2633371 RepID=UPI000812CC00|nr:MULTISPECIES: lysozyme inhibitor LprI family protein [unclassified Ensifer]OCP09254.1 urease-associated protein [Ensifer sp. LC13]OCP10438.1 urease-associated protein [Ensifer sp. LC11]OCP13958.1 urease-associated protein [Ensifer sp. LC14]OCP32502.1 urease-associated protein [Ensifer sp. LC499]
MRFPVLILVSFVGSIGLAPAASAADCDTATSQAAMNECADKSFDASDAELNTLYKQIEARLKDNRDATKLLVTAQKAWIAFRDAECTFSASGVDGGSAYPMVLSQCQDGVTQNRIKDFKTYLSCQEGDLSCPLPPGN